MADDVERWRAEKKPKVRFAVPLNPAPLGNMGVWDGSFLGKNQDGSFRYPEHEPKP